MRWMALVVILAAAAACGPKRQNQCAGNVTGQCVNGEVCSMDRARGCQVCQCRPWDQTPTGTDPDDSGAPPIPVH